MPVWHPDAKRVPSSDAGSFTGGKPKTLWHSTEGPTFAGALSTLVSKGVEPHFLLGPKTGELAQFIAIDRAAKALAHPAGTGETNRDNVVQIELVGFAAQTQDWSDAEYAHIAKLSAWIHENHGTPNHCGVIFAAPGQARRLSWPDYHAYSGHLGHEHAPSNDHEDPGALRIRKVFDRPPKPPAFTKDEAHTVALITTERQRKTSVARRALILACKAKLLFYRARLRSAAKGDGWDKADRRRRYAALLAVYQNRPIA